MYKATWLCVFAIGCGGMGEGVESTTMCTKASHSHSRGHLSTLCPAGHADKVSGCWGVNSFIAPTLFSTAGSGLTWFGSLSHPDMPGVGTQGVDTILKAVCSLWGVALWPELGHSEFSSITCPSMA